MASRPVARSVRARLVFGLPFAPLAAQSPPPQGYAAAADGFYRGRRVIEQPAEPETQE